MTSLFFWLGILLAALAIPMALGRVPRNRWYGYRTPRTLADDRTWDVVNRVSGKGLVVGGILDAIMALVWGRVFADPESQKIANVVTLVVMIVTVMIWTEVTTRR